MSAENVEAVRRFNALFNRGDREEWPTYFHPDVEWRDLQHAPDAPETVRGVPAIETIFDQWTEAFPDLSAEIEEYIDIGDRVVVVTQWRAKGSGSGLSIELRTADVYEFEDGKVVRATIGYTDKDAALRAVGVGEQGSA